MSLAKELGDRKVQRKRHEMLLEFLTYTISLNKPYMQHPAVQRLAKQQLAMQYHRIFPRVRAKLEVAGY